MEKLFVGNLPYSLDNESLSEAFRHYGNVSSAVVIQDRETGRSKGFGFVEMAAEEALRAMDKMNGKELGGRLLTVGVARPHTEARDVTADAASNRGPHLAMLATDDGIRVVPLIENTFDINLLSGLHRFLYVSSLESVRTREAVEELETLINNPKVRESELQAFFEAHQDLLIGDNYRAARPHLALERDTEGPLIPDFLLEPFDQDGLADLLELKLPSAKLIVGSPNRRRFSASVTEACAQLRTYRDYFEDPRACERFYAIHGLRLFRPRMFVLIGRRLTMDPIELRRLESEVQVWTYDDVLAKAKRREWR
jgi:hypothetical protein